jgi:hypothetical protein
MKSALIVGSAMASFTVENLELKEFRKYRSLICSAD